MGAEKLDEDYPDMSSQFYSDGKFVTVVLTSRHSAADVSIRLGPKAGVLVGTVADAVTGAPLNPCVELIRASEPNNFMGGSGLVKRRPLISVLDSQDLTQSRTNFNRGSIRDQQSDFIHFRVSHGYAAVRPINHAMH